VHLGVNVHCYDINKTSLGRTAQGYQFIDKAGILEYDLREGTKFVRLTISPQIGDLTNYLDVLQGLDYISVFEDDKSYINSLIQDYRNLVEKVTTEGEIRKKFINNSAKGIFCIMQYNVGAWYNGKGEAIPVADELTYLNLQKTILDKYAPDILCIQEFTEGIGMRSDYLAIRDLLAPRYDNIFAYPKDTYQGKCICTNRQAQNPSFVDYVGTWMNYEKLYITCNGKKICFVSTHWGPNAEWSESDAQQLLNAIEGEEYVVICLDSNVNILNKGELYQNTLKLFEDAGYIVHNQDMITSKNDTAIDNIITTSNITMKSLIVDKEKDILDKEQRDHYPLVGYFEIY
jgi:hypothetical protein